jgi:hypothetical protein
MGLAFLLGIDRLLFFVPSCWSRVKESEALKGY